MRWDKGQAGAAAAGLVAGSAERTDGRAGGVGAGNCAATDLAFGRRQTGGLGDQESNSGHLMASVRCLLKTDLVFKRGQNLEEA
jgi:hypothetical protein